MVAFSSPQSPDDSRYKQMWAHERNRRIEVEQENIRLRKIVYNTKFSINERAVALEIAEQVKEARHVDEQGRKLFSPKIASERLGLSRGTISTSVDILAESGFVKDRDTNLLRDKEGKIVKTKKGKPISTVHLDIEQDLYEDFSQVERSAPRKIKDNRKTPVFQCQKCLTEDVTIETSRHLVCRNPNCKACGERVLIDVDYKDQHSEEPPEEPAEETTYSVQNLDTIPTTKDSIQNLSTIELMDNSVQNLDTIHEDESNIPPTSVSAAAAADHESIIRDWLDIRFGTSRVIKATEKLTQAEKYATMAESYKPDMKAFIQGEIEHIYGSCLLNSEGKTRVLCFDVDYHDPKAPDPHWLEQAQNWLWAFRRAGVTAVYWQRGQGGHFELYFDQPVYPERARYWAYSICPDLEEIAECYPCQSVAKKYLSWPMWQRRANVVKSTPAHVMLPEPYEGGLQQIDPTDKEALASLITVAVTSICLVEEYSARADELYAEQKRGKEREREHGGDIGIKPKPLTQVGSNKDLVPQVIADFNACHSWDDIAVMAGGWSDKSYFKAVWRGERTASVKPDKDGRYAKDWGNYGSFPEKLDRYGAYCLIHGIDQKADLAERCAEYRRQQAAVAAPEEG